MINRGKRSKTMNEVKPVKNKQESSEFSRDKPYAKGSPSFLKTARPFIWVVEFFWIKGR